MKTKIEFYDLQMLIFRKSEKVTHYYGELMYIRYEKPYCHLFFADKHNSWIEMSITTLMDYLPDSVFLMCKRSTIVNLCYFKRLTYDPLTIEMSDGEKFAISKANALDFNLMIETIQELSPSCPDCFACKPDCKKQPLYCRQNNSSPRNTSPHPVIPAKAETP